MRICYSKNRLFWLILFAAWALPVLAGIDVQPATFYIQLIRGTDQERRQEVTWKPVGPKLSQKLSPVFRWKKYWEVNCQPISVELGRVSRSRLSDVRQVEIEPLSPSEMEIRLFLKGKLVQTYRQTVGTRMTIMGGDRVKDESWFVVVRRDKPQ